jgi:hypothetical protein
MRMTRSIVAALLAVPCFAGAMVLGACEARMPTFPTPVSHPDVAISRMDLVASSNEATRYDLVLTLTNPNDEALPLVASDYTVEVNGAKYRSDSLPNATLPASGSVTFALPAIITAAPGNQFSAQGEIEYFPPGQIKRLFYELGWPKPRVPFKGAGIVQPKPVEEKKTERKGRVESAPIPPKPEGPSGPLEPKLPPTAPPQ